MIKRFKYTKDIIYSMIDGKNNQESFLIETNEIYSPK